MALRTVSRTCCGCINVKIATITIAVLLCLEGLIGIAMNSYAVFHGKRYAISFMLPCGLLIGHSVAAIYGVKNNKPKELIPVMVILIIQALMFGILAFVTILSQVNPYMVFSRWMYFNEVAESKLRLIILCVTCCSWIMVVVKMWFLNTVHKCNKLLMSSNPDEVEAIKRIYYV
ncbi:hypothetical protein L596_024694 [Steinernema carpocapsae]|uniref:Uncharacterized protein n=2 Tax=Steinernema carpocapsae TaxID=34508 RepID=A0A4U5M5J0_STECR|nr:hypothetical protein L596_024694 [Steinernema carpocapsae]